MSAIIKMALFCDRCSTPFAEPGQSLKQLRQDARQYGWRHFGLNGALRQDVCPTCRAVGVKRAGNNGNGWGKRQRKPLTRAMPYRVCADFTAPINSP